MLPGFPLGATRQPWRVPWSCYASHDNVRWSQGSSRSSPQLVKEAQRRPFKKHRKTQQICSLALLAKVLGPLAEYQEVSEPVLASSWDSMSCNFDVGICNKVKLGCINFMISASDHEKALKMQKPWKHIQISNLQSSLHLYCDVA